MTEISFHFGAPDKIAYTCRLLRKAVRAGNRIWVVVDEQYLHRLDAELWSVSPVDFVAHCFDNADASMLNYSHVVLATSSSALQKDRHLLVNLSDAMPLEFDRCSKLIEVVSVEEDDRALARQRWKKYTSMGYSLMKHDLQLKGMH